MTPVLYKLSCQVTIGKLQFKEVVKVAVKSSWKELTDTCEIELPKNLKLKGKSVSEYISRDDKVEVKLGYNGELKTEFKGFVRRIESDIPLKVFCDDYAFKLKWHKPKNKMFASAKLSDVVGHIVEGIEGIKIEVLDNANLGKFIIENTTTSKVLETIRQNYGLVSFFRGNTLFVGFPYKNKPITRGASYVYDFQNNIVPSHSLKYRKTNTIKMKIKAISNLSNGKKLTVEVGQDGGSIVTRNFPHLSKSELEKLAKEELKKYKYEGFTGELTAWGQPFVSHGDSVVLIDSEFPGRRGKYLIDATTVSFDASRFRRKVSIGQKIG